MVATVDRLLSTTQVARKLGLSDRRVTQLAADGKLPCVPTPIGRLFDPEDVAAFAARRAASTPRGRKPAAMFGADGTTTSVR
jgi:excisionase family DNA binding protein